jgi:hypothetical protein
MIAVLPTLQQTGVGDAPFPPRQGYPLTRRYSYRVSREMPGSCATDAQWAILLPLLPPRNRICRLRADDRRTLNAILYVLRTGCAWLDLPKH